MNKVLIAYHSNCTDGYTAAWVAHNHWEKIAKEVYMMPVGYKEEDYAALEETVTQEKYDALWIVDFSVPISTLEAFQRLAPLTAVSIIDHHKTAFERYGFEGELQPNSRLDTEIHGANIVLKNDESGASLVWWVLYPTKRVPNLVKYVKDYDLWQFKLGEATRWVNKVLRDREQSIRSWNEIAAALDNPQDSMRILEAGAKLQQDHDATVQKLVGYAEEVTIKGVKTLVVECDPRYSSDVGHELAKITGTMGATYSFTDTGETEIWSLRSVKGFDVSGIAKKFGGGGHATAAGFRLPAGGSLV